jgi:DNA-binding transcriptional ArsR family regulator
VARIESLTVVQNPAHAALVLHYSRQLILEHLAEPSSAAALARRLGLPRQRVNYHLRELEKAGFLELVEERRKGNCLERVVRAKAKSYLISPQALGRLGPASDEPQDGFSASYLMTLASKAIREVASLRDQPRTAGTRLATISLETRVRFKDAASRNAFAEELATALGRLVAKYHHEADGGGRLFQFLLAGYPTPGGTEVPPAAKSVDSAP